MSHTINVYELLRHRKICQLNHDNECWNDSFHPWLKGNWNDVPKSSFLLALAPSVYKYNHVYGLTLFAHLYMVHGLNVPGVYRAVCIYTFSCGLMGLLMVNDRWSVVCFFCIDQDGTHASPWKADSPLYHNEEISQGHGLHTHPLFMTICTYSGVVWGYDPNGGGGTEIWPWDGGIETGGLRVLPKEWRNRTEDLGKDIKKINIGKSWNHSIHPLKSLQWVSSVQRRPLPRHTILR